MTKVTVDLSAIRNEISIIRAEAFSALEKGDRERRDTLGKIVERIKTLEARLQSDSTKVEIK